MPNSNILLKTAEIADSGICNAMKCFINLFILAERIEKKNQIENIVQSIIMYMYVPTRKKA